uniref:Interleukin 12 receptor, beta 2a n=1 Tax=Tetraodon nigroviridis TaxID=99883 RepID=H3C5H0_TETNG
MPMAVRLPTWTFFTAVIMQLCTGENSCSIRSTAGPVVQLGSSFQIYCTFKCKCKGSMYSDHPPTPKAHEVFNATTVYIEVANITRNQTYSCQCVCPHASDSCGMDIFTGYPPAVPSNVSCIYKVQTNESRAVVCTWSRGRDTHLTTGSVLRVRTTSGVHTSGPLTYSVSGQDSHFLSTSLDVSHSVQQISVWVESQNPLGSAESAPLNYTLRDIATPSAPDLSAHTCSSRECVVQVGTSVRTQELEIQYRSGADAWTSLPDSGRRASLTQIRSISSLRPYRLYHFRARARLDTGMWSQWSAKVSSWTQEEAPAREPDVWHAEADVRSLKVYWKEEDLSAARGKITWYRISVGSRNSGPIFSANISADVRNYTVPFGPGCGVTVWSCTAKGCSPPARISPGYTKAEPLQVRHETAGEHNATIYWSKAGSAGQQGYVVEWYPEGRKLEALQWLRLGSQHSHALITGLEPFECYAGAVYAVHSDSSVGRSGFTGVATLESVPAAVPSVLEKVEGNSVNVSWMQIPRGQRGGCITTYTIYLESSSGGERQVFPVAASEKTYVIEGLSPAAYTLWVTASTAKGEGPTGPRSKVKFFIQRDSSNHPTGGCARLLGPPHPHMSVPEFCREAEVRGQQLAVKLLLRFLLPDEVPDPANSKWAKECVLQPGEMKLQLQTSVASVTAEDDPILVEVEELPQPRCRAGTSGPCPRLLSPTALSPTSRPDVLLYPRTTYIKSVSHDSSSSKQTSVDTNITVDYISAHEPGHQEVISFFPSHDFAMEPLEFGGKLTLDAVKINCGEFFQNSF